LKKGSRTATWVAVDAKERPFRSRYMKWLWDEEARPAMVREEEEKKKNEEEGHGAGFYTFGSFFRVNGLGFQV